MARMTKFIISVMLSYQWIIFSAYAINDDIVSIKQVSSSGRTLFLNRGKFDDVGEDDYGVLILREKIDESKNIYRPIGKIKLVRVYDRESIWVVYKVLMPKQIVKGKKFIFLNETAMLKGRTKLKIKRTSVVTNKDRKKEIRDFVLEGDSLAKRKENYKVLDIAHKKEKHFDKDIDLIDVDKWENKLGDDKLFVSGVYRSPYAEEFSKRKRVQTFEKMVVAYLNKYNDIDFDYEKFYKEQKRAAVGNLSGATLYGNYKDKYEEKLLSKKQQRSVLAKNIKKNGQAWSKEYSDEQLSELLNEMSILKEKKRRETLVAYKFNYQAIFSFGLNLINNENRNDPDTSEQSRYDLEVALESYYFKKLETLKSFTMELSARRAQDAYFGGDLNVSSTEYSMALHMNWYPFYRPSALNKNIIYIGLLSRFGIATLSNNTSDEVGNYQVFSLPGVRAGLKYNFDNTYGFRVTGSFENLRSERIVRNDDEGSLPSRASYKEGKVSFGLTKFF